MRTITLTSLVIVLLAGCAGVELGPQPSATVTTSNPAWQNWLKLSYDVDSRGEQRKIAGYVINEYGSPMRAVQVLAQALDGSEQVVAQRIVHLPGELPPFGRSYFEVRGMPAAQNYRVTVWSFDRIEHDSSWP